MYNALDTTEQMYLFQSLDDTAYEACVFSDSKILMSYREPWPDLQLGSNHEGCLGLTQWSSGKSMGQVDVRAHLHFRVLWPETGNFPSLSLSFLSAKWAQSSHFYRVVRPHKCRFAKRWTLSGGRQHYTPSPRADGGEVGELWCGPAPKSPPCWGGVGGWGPLAFFNLW